MKMYRHAWRALLGACGMLMLASSAQAQGPLTLRISHIMPMGGQAGSTFELRVTGQDLADVQGLHFSFPGVKTEMLGTETAPSDKRGKPTSPVTTVKFKITLPLGAPLGIQDVRIIAKAGISNPRAFVVGDLKEFVEREPNNDVPSAQKIELNSTVSGVISAPQDVDFYQFLGKKGDRVVCSCLTTSIDSKLPAEIQIYSANDVYLGGNRSYDRNDALLDAVLPADGVYFVRVSSFGYIQGGVDNFYRLTVTTAPWIDAVFPPVVEPGKETRVIVYGRNLPGGVIDSTAEVNGRKLEKAELTVKAPQDPTALQKLSYTGYIAPHATMLDGFELRVKGAAGSSNPFLMTYAAAPVVLDAGENDEQAKAQKLTLPCVIAGRIEKKADRDWYAFAAKKGEVWTIDAFADRLGAAVDLYFQLFNSGGTMIVERDDTAELMSPLFPTRNEDPTPYRFVVPADGTYYLMVTSRDAYTAYSPRHFYTIHMTREEPDFRLVAMPPAATASEALTVNQGGGAAYNVYVWRLGGFNDEIIVTGEDLPPGVRIAPQRISREDLAPGGRNAQQRNPNAQKQSVIGVHADATAAPWAGAIKLVGTANVGGSKRVREVRSATLFWPSTQNNVPAITRMDRELVLAVRDKAPYRLEVGAKKIRVRHGEKISIPVSLQAESDFKSSVQIAALNGPAGAIPSALSLDIKSMNGTMTIETKAGKSVPPGNYTIFLRGETQPTKGNQPRSKGAPPNLVQISEPVAVTILPNQLAKVSLAKMFAKVEAGKEVAVNVRVSRLFDIPLSFKVEAILPPGSNLSAKEVVLQAGEDDARLIISASPQAVVGSTTDITVRATAMFDDTIPVVHETKFTVMVSK